MVEQFGGIHSAIVMRFAPSIPVSPYNRRVNQPPYPQRIACLQPSATVILARLGELGRVVACTKYCAEVVPELRNHANDSPALTVSATPRLIVADSWTSKATEILAARPDLVIAAVPYQEAAVTEILKAGIRFLGLAPRTLGDIYTDIALIAGAVGATENGAQLVRDMQNAIADFQLRTSKLPRKRVFCEEWGKPIIASQPWVAELVAAAGGEFLCRPGKQCSSEEIAALQPEVLIAAWCGAGDRVPLSKIVTQRAWEQTPAARNSQVYCVSDELLNTPAPTLLGGLRALAGAIHPGEFGVQPGLRRITKVPQALTQE
jgi:iron complex transport system substrate-binding protein